MSTKFELDDSGLKKALNNLQKNASKLKKGDKVNFEELFTDKFMSENTKFSSLDEFVDASGFYWSTPESFDAIPDEDMDKFVTANTNFSSWEDMMTTAGQELIAKKLGF